MALDPPRSVSPARPQHQRTAVMPLPPSYSPPAPQSPGPATQTLGVSLRPPVPSLRTCTLQANPVGSTLKHTENPTTFKTPLWPPPSSKSPLAWPLAMAVGCHPPSLGLPQHSYSESYTMRLARPPFYPSALQSFGGRGLKNPAPRLLGTTFHVFH